MEEYTQSPGDPLVDNKFGSSLEAQANSDLFVYIIVAWQIIFVLVLILQRYM
jgi:hypothetical protein